LKIERIISQGQSSPPEFWFNQAWNEWMIVLKGGFQAPFGASVSGCKNPVPN
jgi:cupin 2 domain-containing protein